MQTVIEKDELYYKPAIGADEVGTGEVLRPQVFVACFVPSSKIMMLEEMGVKDSKKMKREDAIKLGKQLSEMLDFEQFSIRNDKLNRIYRKIPNLNKIKAISHDFVINKLNKKLANNNIDTIILDAFCSRENYLEYIEKEDTPIIFLEKAEDRHIAVACASLIATYIESLILDELEEELGEELPGGNTRKTTAFLEKLYKTKGEEGLLKYAKETFTPVQKLLK